ncbi:hypothetical protein [Caminibacter pacificus]
MVITIEVNDKYVKTFLEFLKLMPKNVVKIKDDFEEEIKQRREEIKKGNVKLLTKEELFDV